VPNCLRLLLVALLLKGSSAFAQSLEVILTDSAGAVVSDAVIELLLPETQRETFAETGQYAIDQVDKEFVPSITAVVAGSEVSFPNSDAILHHVYSFSPAQTFNIPLYGRGENRDYFQSFTQPGVVEIGCNIHDWMLAYIYVGESQLMATTNAEGVATLPDLPAGEFQLQVWHSQLDAPNNIMLTDVSLVEGESTSVQLALSLQRDRRIRRAPSANRTRYR